MAVDRRRASMVPWIVIRGFAMLPAVEIFATRGER
jgi:hypothetical protein